MIKPSVLFVCLGNICRSPSAEGVLRKLAADRGLAESIRIESAGTGAWHAGELPDPRARRAAASRGYCLDSPARQVVPRDLVEFDLIVAMDGDNYDNLLALDRRGVHRAKIRLLSEFLPAGSPRDVPDPYYQGPHGFEVVLDMLEAACPRILDELLVIRQ